MILDLKDKISIEDTSVQKEMNAYRDALETEGKNARSEAVEALTALGYSPAEALKAVKKAAPGEDMDVETILKLALKTCFERSPAR